MGKLWGGRFTKDTDKKVFEFNASIDFDKRLLEHDILGSIAHAGMLFKQGIISGDEYKSIESGLNDILKEVKDGTLAITGEYEDVHSFVEANLINKVGDAGKRLHTGRSRNDQVALDMRLYVRSELFNTVSHLKELLTVINNIMKSGIDTYMPGFTHMQKAQPITLAHHFGAYFEMFKRDYMRIIGLFGSMNECPLGAGALAGTTYPLDRKYVSDMLKFNNPTRNSIDSVSDRDYLIEYLSDLSIIMMHLSRFCEEIIMWNSDEYRFIEMDDAYSTGSSIMPQKKNPDIAELVRGKTGRVYGALMSLLTTMKGLPLAYNKDMQEDKEVTFDAIDTVNSCIPLFAGMLSTITFNTDRMKLSASNGFTNATDCADYLVKKGMPFREAHEVTGKLVLYCIDNNKALDDLSILEYKSINNMFEEDIYEAISLKTCVENRTVAGGPSKTAIEEEIKQNDTFLASI